MMDDNYFDSSAFPKLAQLSAKQYLSFLDASKNFAGRKVISVMSVQPANLLSDYILILSDKINNPDFCEIWINGRAEKRIKILKYTSSGNAHRIRVRVESNYFNLKIFPADQIKIISDMRFLVRRLWGFYSSCDALVKPALPHDLPALPDNLLNGLSDEQKSAIEGIATSPVSYVSGAPGTGKTQAVLSRAILRYALAGERVILLAPTNNAVEQMLYGVLPVLKNAGINLTSVYRIGVSSEAFASRYPQVVGDSNTDALLESLTFHLSEKEQTLKRAKEINKEYIDKKITLVQSRGIHNKILSLFDELSSCKVEIESINQKINFLQLEQKYRQNDVRELHIKVFDSDKTIKACEQVISENNTRADSFIYRFWKRKQRLSLLEENDRLSEDLTKKKIECAKLQQDFNASEDALNKVSLELGRLREDLSRTNSCYAETERLILSASSENSEYHQLVLSILESKVIVTDILNDYISELDKVVISLKDLVEENNISALTSAIDVIKDQLSAIGKTAKQKQKEAALVLAGTIDASLSYLKPGDESVPTRPIAHVFLDEAGYTSIIRGMTVFFCGAPVTFLGDHKQLPPVCEMNKISSETAPVCLWALSVAYYPELIFGSLQDLYIDCYCAAEEPLFANIKYLPLTKSFRFGTLLANILAKHIYNDRFTGAGDSDFEIKIIHAGHEPGPYNRSSLSEAMQIKNFISKYNPERIAVLAPYNNQVKLLQRTLPYSYKASVMTVHRSQGREWDTVVLSVTDTFNRYFTDSQLPIGKRIINTAISRAKHRLVLVCDTNIWHQHPEQMIADLIRSGEITSPVDMYPTPIF